MTAADYRDSLRSYKPRVYVDGQAVTNVAHEPVLAPGIHAVGRLRRLPHRAGALTAEANGLDFYRHGHLREAMVEL